MTEGIFIHSVYFWLHDPKDPAVQQQFETAIQHFINGSAYVLSAHIGKAAGTPREVVDNSYSYSLIVNFASKADQDLYQKEPVHLDFVEKNQHLWDRVQVYDSIRL